MLWEPERVWQLLLTLNVLKSCESFPFQVPDRIMKDDESKIDLYTISPAVESSASHRRAQLFFDCCPRNQWSSLMHWDLILLEAHSSLAGPKSCRQQAVKMLEAAIVTPFLIPDPCQRTILHILFYHEGKSRYIFSLVAVIEGKRHSLKENSGAVPFQFCSIQASRSHSVKLITRMQSK